MNTYPDRRLSVRRGDRTAVARDRFALIGDPGVAVELVVRATLKTEFASAPPVNVGTAKKLSSVRLAQQQAAAAQELGERCTAKRAEPSCDALVRQRAELLGHRETPLPEAALGWRDIHVQGVREVRAGERDGERET